MWDWNSKEGKNIEISLGLLVGYILVGLIYFWVIGIFLKFFFLDEKIIIVIVGIGLILFIYYWNKNKVIKEEE